MEKITREQVELEGQVYMMTEEQMGDCWVEVSCKEELDNIRLVLARAVGAPEPELNPEEVQEAKDFREEEKLKMDMERILEKLIQIHELQDRMEKGMSLIQEATEKKDAIQLILTQAQEGVIPRIPYMQYLGMLEGIKGWKARLSNLWDTWKMLKNECVEIVGEDKVVWAMYFQSLEGEETPYTKLLKEELLPYNTSGDSEALDNQEGLTQSQNELMEDILCQDLMIRE